MRVLRFDLLPVEDCANLFEAKMSVEDRPFTWVLEHQIYVLPDTMDPGPLEAEELCEDYFSNWRRYGEEGDRSKIIPDSMDLAMDYRAHRTLRMFGTLAMVESIKRKEFQKEGKGLAGYAQFLARCRYVTNTTDFERDLLPAAKKRLAKWDETSLIKFVARILMKKPSSVSLGDITQVIGVLTGQQVNEDDENFSLANCLEYLKPEEAAEKRPDEFFTAAMGFELMERAIVERLLQPVGDALYFGPGAILPVPKWIVSGPENVRWQITVRTNYAGTQFDWAPEKGTYFERALGSKKKMFPNIQEATVPFTVSASECSNLDTGAFEIKPGTVETGMRYLTADITAPIYRCSLPVTDWPTVVKEIRGSGIMLPVDPSPQEVAVAFEKLYMKHRKNMDEVLGSRHYMVYSKGLRRLVQDPELEDRFKEATAPENVQPFDAYVLPDMTTVIRGFLAYVWILKHMDSDVFCHVSAENDDYSLLSAIETALTKGVEDKKASTIHLVNCAFSEPFRGRKVRPLDFKDADLADFLR